MQRRIHHHLAAASLAVAAVWAQAPGAAAESKPKIQGIYSNLDPGETAGVLTGMEVFIVPYIDGESIRYSALVQFADTIPERPQLVELEANGRQVSFTAVHPLEGAVRFEGEAEEDALIGELETLGEVKLPKGESLWQMVRDSQ